MPNGEFRPSRNALLVSATPSPSASRSSVMRLALGTPAPARLHDHSHDPAPDAVAVVRLRRRVAFRHQHVAIRQHVDRARMIEPAGERIDRHAVGGGRLGAGRPAGGGGDIDRRYPGFLRRRQGRGGPESLLGDGGIGGLVAGGERKHQHSGTDAQQYSVAHDGSHGDCQVQCGRPVDVHGFCYEFRVMENPAGGEMLLCMGSFSIFW